MELGGLMAARPLINRQNHTLTQVGRVSIRHGQRLQKSNHSLLSLKRVSTGIPESKPPETAVMLIPEALFKPNVRWFNVVEGEFHER